jgi:hypothetical protein
MVLRSSREELRGGHVAPSNNDYIAGKFINRTDLSV